MKVPVRALSFALALLPVPGRAASGVYLEEELIRGAAEGAPTRETTRTWVVPGKLRKEQPASATVTLVREDEKVVRVLSERDRTWFELDRATLDRLGELGLAALLHSKDEDPSSWLKPSGRRRKVGAWNAREVVAEGRPLPGARISIWLSTEVPVSRALRRVMMGESFGSSNPGALLLKGLRELDGYPVEIQLEARIAGATVSTRQSLLRVEQQEVAAERFEVPAGYRRVASPFDPLLEGTPASGAAPAPLPTQAPLPDESAAPAAAPSPR